MPQLNAASDFVRVPPDSTGKYTGFLLATVTGGQLYIPASVLVDASGNTIDPRDTSDRAARLLGHVTVDSAPSTAVTGPLTDAQLRAAAVPVSGVFFQATQPVSFDALPAGDAGIGRVKVTDGTSVAPVNALSGLHVYATQNGLNKSHSQPNVRVVRNLRMASTQALTTGDVLASLTQFYNNATVVATTTPAVVPAGKALRILAIEWFISYTGATNGWAEFDLRVNTAGLAIVSSPNFHKARLGGGTSVVAAGQTFREFDNYGPDGLIDIPAGAGIGVTVRGLAGADVGTIVTARVACTITAYEYTL